MTQYLFMNFDPGLYFYSNRNIWRGANTVLHVNYKWIYHSAQRLHMSYFTFLFVLIFIYLNVVPFETKTLSWILKKSFIVHIHRGYV